MNPAISKWHRWSPALTLLAGGASVFSLAPFGLWSLQLLSIAVLAWAVGPALPVRRAALLGWAYSFAATAGSVYWLYISLHRYGGMPAPMAALAVALLAAAMACYGALAMAGVCWLSKRLDAGAALRAIVIFPACWLLGEWLRGWLFTGFPWAASGYAHTDGPLAGYAALVGVYGLAGVAAAIGGCLALLPRLKLPMVLVLVLIVLGSGLQQVEWTRPSGQPISVRLLQGNVPQEVKFEPGQIQANLTLYENMIRSAPADLIATPETALPLLLQQLPADYLDRLADFSRQSGSHLMIGIPVSDSPVQYANSVLGLQPASNAAGTAPAGPAPAATPAPRQLYRYDKHHLVPFGEFIPTGARWFVDMMSIPLGDFTRGGRLQAPFPVKDQLVLPNICYEDLFGEEIADQIASSTFAGVPQPTILLNMSNIAWFGDSIALPQHLQISRMRTLETGRPMLRATNTGATAVIDSRGDVTARLAPYTRGILSASVQGRTGWTPYILLGNWLPVGLAMATLAGLWLARRNRRPAERARDRGRAENPDLTEPVNGAAPS